MFFRFSLPDQILSNQGQQFESRVWRNYVNCFRLKSHELLHTTLSGRWIGGEDQSYIVKYVIYNSGGAPGGVGVTLVACLHGQVFNPPGLFTLLLMFGRTAGMPIDLVYGTNNPNS